LKLEAQLGQGEFGVVYRATARYIIPFESETIVAVKTLKSYADEISFNVLASELKILSNLGHHLNIVNLLGAVTRKIVNHEILLILEYCSLGNLQSFLLVNRLNFEDDLGFCTKTSSDFLNELGKNYFGKQVRFVHKPNGYVQIPLRRNSTRPIIFDTFSNIDSRAPKTSDLVSWSFQCSRGMEYLSSKKIIHGDLAARNILLCDGNVIKITDFGLSKSLYKNYQITRDKKLPLPYKWLAIECFTDNIFSIQSDIWSYGILLWELFSLAQSPYPGFEQSVELYQFLIEGSRMEKPYVANDKIYQLMLQCWSKNPQERPLFHEISEVLGRFLHESVKGVSI
jgi:FMS-like tyrosine kinase 1